MKNLKVEALLRPVVDALGYELWACDYLSQGKHSILRVYIDKAEGIDIDDCSRVSHEVSAILDVEDPIAGFYQLEVSSPGMDRPLYEAAHFARFSGHRVSLKLSKALSSGAKKMNGEIGDVVDNTVTIQCDEGPELIDISNIFKANLVG